MALPTDILIGTFLLLPGFIFIQVRERLIPSPRRDFSKSATEFVGYSAVNYILFSPIIVPRLQDWSQLELGWLDYLAVIGITLVAPLIGAIAGFRLSQSNLVERLAGLGGTLRLMEPTAWDYFFGRRKIPCWVMVRLRNGESVAGIYGIRSFASRYPDPPSLYLETTYRLTDERIDTKVEDGAGVLISGEDIHLVEFWEIQGVERGQDDRQAGKADAQGRPD